MPSSASPWRWRAIPYAAWAGLTFLLLGVGVLILILPIPWQGLRRRMVRR